MTRGCSCPSCMSYPRRTFHDVPPNRFDIGKGDSVLARRDRIMVGLQSTRIADLVIQVDALTRALGEAGRDYARKVCERDQRITDLEAEARRLDAALCHERASVVPHLQREIGQLKDGYISISEKYSQSQADLVSVRQHNVELHQTIQRMHNAISSQRRAERRHLG